MPLARDAWRAWWTASVVTSVCLVATEAECQKRRDDEAIRGVGGTGIAAADGSDDAPVDPEQDPIDLLTFHRPTYFLSSFSQEIPVKFQLSIKYELWPNRGAHHLYAAYTQLSLWRAYDFADSSPFDETNYAPAAFYAHRHQRLTRSICQMSDEQVGYMHTSNGERGDRSRSWERFYAELSAACGRETVLSATIISWWPFGLSQNPEIVDYVGYGSVTLKAAIPLGIVGSGDLSLTGQKGVSSDPSRGNLVAVAAWHPPYAPPVRRVWRFLPFVYAELFCGYGETLTRYDEGGLVFRLGVALDDDFPETTRSPIAETDQSSPGSATP